MNMKMKHNTIQQAEMYDQNPNTQGNDKGENVR